MNPVHLCSDIQNTDNNVNTVITDNINIIKNKINIKKNTISKKYTINDVISQNLDYNNVTLNNMIIKSQNSVTRRFIPITSDDNKGYYVLIENLDPSSVFCSSKDITYICPYSGKEKTNKIYNFNLRNVNDVNKNISNDNIIDKLNNFRKGIMNRLKYITMLPNYDDNKYYGVKINSIRINNKLLYKNIIEYDGNKNNFSFNIIRNVLINCNCKLLLKINYLIISPTDTTLDIRIVRIYPESLDTLENDTQIMILDTLHERTNKNFNSILKIESENIIHNTNHNINHNMNYRPKYNYASNNLRKLFDVANNKK